MLNKQVRELGLRQLATVETKSDNLGEWKTWLASYQFDKKHPDDRYVWLTCVLALQAVNTGNFGVGCILTDSYGNVVVQAHNQVFNPYFRSDRHAEMVVMDEFEDTHQEVTGLEGYTLYTSLEPCPMCLSRLITSGVGKILYAVADPTGGMVHKIKDLPEIWTQLAQRQIFDQARCTQDLTNAANCIFLVNADELNEELKKR